MPLIIAIDISPVRTDSPKEEIPSDQVITLALENVIDLASNNVVVQA